MIKRSFFQTVIFLILFLILLNKYYITVYDIIPPKFYIFCNNTLLVYKAVYDSRMKIIRILAAMKLNLNISLIDIMVDRRKVNFSIKILGRIIKFNIQFTLKYVNFIINKTNIAIIEVNKQVIPYEYIKEIVYKYNFTVCISSLKNNFVAKTLVDQTLSIYKKEGVEHAIIYYGDISNEVYTLLNKYVLSGFLEIFYWPELEILSYIRNNGQILKMNDCLYRSYYNSRYIINSDIDEIIMPATFYTLTELINHYLINNSNCNMFKFYSKTFPTKKYIDNISKYGREIYYKLPPIDDINLYEKTLSCKETIVRTKYIISTFQVEAIRFHDAITKDNYCMINIKDGHCRHTRIIPKNNIHLCINLTHDKTILKYK